MFLDWRKTILADWQLLCILTSFWVLRAPKSWSNYFFQLFSTFFVHFKPFSVISRLKSTKNIWKRTKKGFCLLLKAGRHAKAGCLPEGVHQNCLFWIDFLLFLNVFLSVFDWLRSFFANLSIDQRFGANSKNKHLFA